MPRSSSGRLGLMLATLGALLGIPEAARAEAGAGEDAADPVARIEAAFTGPYTGFDGRTGHAGKVALGEMGIRTLGPRSSAGRRWLTRWDAALAARGSYLGSARPLTALLGGRGLLEAESGYRVEWRSPLSLYVGGHAHLDLEWLEPAGRRGSTLSDMAWLPAFGVQVKGRVGMGASYLADGYSLLLVAFAQSARRPTALSPSGTLFTEGGLAARFDLGGRLSTSLEATWGKAGVHHDPTLGLADRTTHEEVSATLRAGFRSGMWIGIGAGLARDLQHSTSGAPDFRLALAFGLPLRR